MFIPCKFVFTRHHCTYILHKSIHRRSHNQQEIKKTKEETRLYNFKTQQCYNVIRTFPFVSDDVWTQYPYETKSFMNENSMDENENFTQNSFMSENSMHEVLYIPTTQ